MSNKSRRYPFAHALSQILRVLLPAGALMVSASLASAQNEPSIGEGAKVRISVPGAKKVTGIVKSRTADSTTIYVEGYGGTRSFLNSDVTELKLSRGKTHLEGAKKGAYWGGGIGAVLAIAILATPEGSRDYEYPSPTNNEIATQTFLGSLIWGVGIGALVKAEHWETIPVHPHFAVSPSSGRAGLSVAFSPFLLH